MTGPGCPESTAAGGGRFRLRLLDLVALVVGYGLAALLIRAFWPRRGMPGTLVALALALEFAWLGLAMAGPVLLLVNRRSKSDFEPQALTRAEQAWSVVGSYWIGLALLVVPTRMATQAAMATWPVLVLLVGLWAVGRLRSSRIDPARAWTHRAAVALLWSWPAAWAVLVFLGASLE